MTAMLRKAALGIGKIAAAPFISLGRGAVAGGAITGLLHILLVGAVVVGLWRLNDYLELDKIVRAPSSLLRELWLPIMFLLAYAIAWTALATWRAATSPHAASGFPELDRCWRQLLATMHRHGVDLTEKPLILMLGEPAGREAELLSSFAITPTFGPTPSQPDAMLKAFADDQAVYLMCHEASLLSTAAERIAHIRSTKQRVSRPFETCANVEQRMPAALRAPVGAGAAVATAVGAPPSNADDAGHDQAELAVPTLGEQRTALEESQGPPPRLFDDQQAERCAAELDRLVQLIKSERGSAPPIDGVVLLTPLDSTDCDATADAVSWALEQDLHVIGATAGVRCPVLSVVSELQHAPGCGRLLHLLTRERKSKRLGVALDARDTDSPGAFSSAITELTDRMSSVLCQRLMEVDEHGEGEAESLRDNAALFDLQSHLSERGERLAGMLSHALNADPDHPWRMSGCFLVATGDPLGGGQAFGAGVLQSLSHGRTAAAWTPDALANDARLTRWANAGYSALAAACLAVGWLLLA